MEQVQLKLRNGGVDETDAVPHLEHRRIEEGDDMHAKWWVWYLCNNNLFTTPDDSCPEGDRGLFGMGQH
jgi:hypothetical protein